jgi:prepilin-type processing-associated H-X9-DG protein
MCRRGITRIELAVAVAIATVLLTLLVPMLNPIRGSRRSMCQNNLRCLTIAIASYQETFCRLPPRQPAGLDFGPLALLLPYLEREDIYEQINFSRPSTDATNATARNVRSRLWTCPADCDSDRPGTNYLGNAGLAHRLDFADQEFAAALHGVFGSRLGMADCEAADGDARTIAFAETLRGGPGYAAFPGEPPNPVPSLPTEMATLRGGRGDDWLAGGHLQSVALLTLGVNSPYADTAYRGFIGGSASARSMHPGGVNVGMLDGTVHFVSDSVDTEIWRALCTSAAGDNASGF